MRMARIGCALALGATLAVPVGLAGQAGQAANAEAPGARESAFAAMDAAYARFTRAYRLGEPDSVLVLYTDRPLYLPGRGDIRRGTEELGRAFGFLRSIREAGASAAIAFRSVERDVSGDLAYDVGYYRLQVEEADGSKRPPQRGKFTTVWKRAPGGGWRIHVDSFSPAPPAEDGRQSR